MGKPKELYADQKDVKRPNEDFECLRTPMGINVRQGMPADHKPPTESMGASEYDGSTAIEADSN